MSLLCLVGLHKPAFSSQYFPSIDAEIVTEFIFRQECANCGKELHLTHKVWNMDTLDYEDVREG